MRAHVGSAQRVEIVPTSTCVTLAPTVPVEALAAAANQKAAVAGSGLLLQRAVCGDAMQIFVVSVSKQKNSASSITNHHAVSF